MTNTGPGEHHAEQPGFSVCFKKKFEGVTLTAAGWHQASAAVSAAPEPVLPDTSPSGWGPSKGLQTDCALVSASVVVKIT